MFLAVICAKRSVECSRLDRSAFLLEGFSHVQTGRIHKENVMAAICHLPFTCTSSSCFESDAPTSTLLLVGLGTECSVSSACHMVSGLVTAFQGMNDFLSRMSSSLRTLTDFGNLLTEMSFSKSFTFSTADMAENRTSEGKEENSYRASGAFCFSCFSVPTIHFTVCAFAF